MNEDYWKTMLKYNDVLAGRADEKELEKPEVKRLLDKILTQEKCPDTGRRTRAASCPSS